MGGGSAGNKKSEVGAEGGGGAERGRSWDQRGSVPTPVFIWNPGLDHGPTRMEAACRDSLHNPGSRKPA